MTFRNTIGNMAVTNVQSYLTRYTQDQTESYVRSVVMYHGEIPFLYWVFKPTNVSVKKEKGGYCHCYDFLVRLRNGLTFFELFKLLFFTWD